MAEETEIVLDRRQLRRSVTLWRVLGIGGLALAFGAFAFGGDKLTSLGQPQQIARVAIEGTILESRDQLRMFEKIADSDRVAALLVYVNSPGGTTTGGEAIHEAIRQIAKKKPVVAQFGTVAASAGYIVGMGADHIVARGNTITGSIGVIAQWPEVASLLDKLGVKVNEVKSGNLKATPSPFLPLDEGGRTVTQNMVNEGFKWFLAMVEARRGVKTGEIAGLEQGRIFSGREALAVKLVDEIGGEAEAVAWLESARGVPKKLKVVDWKPSHDDGWGVPNASAGLTGRGLGETAADLVRALGRDTRLDTLTLDGLVSVWHQSEK
jgi:protease IV